MTRIDYDAIFSEIPALIKSGVCEPTFADLARYFEVESETLRQGLVRNYNVTPEMLLSFQALSSKEASKEVTYQKVFSALRDNELTMAALADKLDMSPVKTKALIAEMQSLGFAINTRAGRAVVHTTWDEQLLDMTPALPTNLAAESIKFGVFSDTHWGSRHAQISAWLAYMHEAYEAGVRVFLFIGDLTSGVGGYKGQEHDMIPSLAPKTRLDYFAAAMALVDQAELYLKMLPFLDEITIYMLGGNHDFWTITNAGFDTVKSVCDRFDNIHYLGYDEFDLKLTEQLTARLWHPTGGIPYARSYRLQKGMENLAYQLLFERMEDMPNNLGFIFAGHLHIEAKVQIGSVVGSQVPCFEGRSNYLKRKGLYPVIGGQVWDVHIREDGQIASTVYQLHVYDEIADDWSHFPVVSERNRVYEEPDYDEIVFKSE